MASNGNGNTKVEKIQRKSNLVMQKLLQKNYRNRFIITMFTLVTFLVIILGEYNELKFKVFKSMFKSKSKNGLNFNLQQ